MVLCIAKRMFAIIAVSLFLVGASNASAQAPPSAGGAAPAAPRADVPPGPPQPVEPGYLGLVTDDRQEAGKGVRVTEAVNGGPGAKGGLMAGDLITGIDGKPIRGNNDMATAISSLPPGTKSHSILTVTARPSKSTSRSGSARRRPSGDSRNLVPSLR